MLGLITAINIEKEAVLSKMENQKTTTACGVELITGRISNTDVLLAMSGVGKAHAARTTQLIIDKYEVSSVINLGLSGALKPELKVGDIIVSTACVQHDVDLTSFEKLKGQICLHDDVFFYPDNNLIDLSKIVAKEFPPLDYNIYFGPIASGDQFINSSEKKTELFNEFGAYCIEMESGVIAQVCHYAKLPFVVIRSITEIPNGAMGCSPIDNNKLAAQRCSDFLAKLIIQMERN